MTEQDFRDCLKVPTEFHTRIEHTLGALPSRRSIRRVTCRALAFAAVIVLLLGTAYAVVSEYGLKYWNTQRVCQPDADETNKLLAAAQPAVEGECTNQLVKVSVHEAAWLDDDQFQMVFASFPRDPAKDELHPMQNLDEDGSVVPKGTVIEEGDDESRYCSFLWTDAGYGLPREMMDNGAKRLLLFEAVCVTIDAPDGLPLPRFMMDTLRVPDGVVQTQLRFDLSAMSSMERQAIENATDENGYLTLCLHSNVTIFTSDEEGIATFDYLHPDDQGITTFKIKIR